MTIGFERSSAGQGTHGSFITSAFRVPRPPAGSHADAAPWSPSIGTATWRPYWTRTKGSSAARSGRPPSFGSWSCSSSFWGFRLDEQRLPEGAGKAKVLRAVDRCKGAISLKSTLRLVRLSPARYHAWKRADEPCELDDRSSCPRSHPTQLTPAEVSTIKEMVTATEYRHMPLRTLSLYAQRAGHVFASATTWAKLVRQGGWRRPRRRVYPEKPKTGIRATHPNSTRTST